MNNYTDHPRLIRKHFKEKEAELKLQNIFIYNHYKYQEIITKLFPKDYIKIFRKRKNNS